MHKKIKDRYIGEGVLFLRALACFDLKEYLVMSK